MSSTWLLILTVFNLIVLSTLTIQIFLRLKEKKEDQRLAKGLQLLQNKISILQDLSDRTDHQVQKTVQTLDQRANQIKELIQAVEEKNQQIRSALDTATETQRNLLHYAQPSPEVDQQNMAMRVHAARLAHQGFSKDQILNQISLNPAEVDLILKINRDKLQFAEDQLPAWASSLPERPQTGLEMSDFEKTLKQQKEKLAFLRGKKVDTLNANSDMQKSDSAVTPVPATVTPVTPIIQSMTSLTSSQNQLLKPGTAVEAKSVSSIRPFVFRKIEARTANSNGYLNS